MAVSVPAVPDAESRREWLEAGFHRLGLDEELGKPWPCACPERTTGLAWSEKMPVFVVMWSFA